MSASYTAIIQQDVEWWIGWVKEIPGVNTQGHTREELLDNLRDALAEALEMNRADARVVTNPAHFPPDATGADDAEDREQP